MCGDSGIDSILITHPAREARQQAAFISIDPSAPGPDVAVMHFYTPSMNDVDLAESYVPFEPPQAQGADSISTENMLGNTAAFILIVGFIFSLVLLGSMIATGNAIPSMQGVSYVQKGR